MNIRPLQPLTALLSLTVVSVALAAAYTSVDVTLNKEVGPLSVGLGPNVSPTLGATNPPVRNGVAYVGASHGVGSWAVGLSPKLPFNLTIRQETGSSEIDLTRLPINQLTLTHDAGPITLRLPSRNLTASVIQETGSLSVSLPRDTGLRVVIKKFETGSLSMEGKPVATGTDLSGTFQTANYDQAKYKAVLSLTRGAGPVEVLSPGSALSSQP